MLCTLNMVNVKIPFYRGSTQFSLTVLCYCYCIPRTRLYATLTSIATQNTLLRKIVFSSCGKSSFSIRV